MRAQAKLHQAIVLCVSVGLATLLCVGCRGCAAPPKADADVVPELGQMESELSKLVGDQSRSLDRLVSDLSATESPDDPAFSTLLRGLRLVSRDVKSLVAAQELAACVTLGGDRGKAGPLLVKQYDSAAASFKLYVDQIDAWQKTVGNDAAMDRTLNLFRQTSAKARDNIAGFRETAGKLMRVHGPLPPASSTVVDAEVERIYAKHADAVVAMVSELARQMSAFNRVASAAAAAGRPRTESLLFANLELLGTVSALATMEQMSASITLVADRRRASTPLLTQYEELFAVLRQVAAAINDVKKDALARDGQLEDALSQWEQVITASDEFFKTAVRFARKDASA